MSGSTGWASPLPRDEGPPPLPRWVEVGSTLLGAVVPAAAVACLALFIARRDGGDAAGLLLDLALYATSCGALALVIALVELGDQRRRPLLAGVGALLAAATPMVPIAALGGSETLAGWLAGAGLELPAPRIVSGDAALGLAVLGAASVLRYAVWLSFIVFVDVDQGPREEDASPLASVVVQQKPPASRRGRLVTALQLGGALLLVGIIVVAIGLESGEASLVVFAFFASILLAVLLIFLVFPIEAFFVALSRTVVMVVLCLLVAWRDDRRSRLPTA